MPGHLNKFSQFWQELKRRKVIRVITVYAAAAFVILEVVSIIVDPLQLPHWTLPMVIVLLCIGFVIAIILSWVYEVTPEGIEKTGPVSVEGKKAEGKPGGMLGWKIATYTSALIIIIMLILNLFYKKQSSNTDFLLEKSIAVLPFINDSDDRKNENFMNGIMEEVLINLQSIKDFKVPGRTSVEKYRHNPDKSTPEIALELGVNYVVESSGQKYGNTFVLRVQLLDGSEGMHLWGKQFRQEINSMEDIVSIQSQIAKAIAEELRTVISPDEKKLIDRIPTSSLTAYIDYREAEEELLQYRLGRGNNATLNRAEAFYRRALTQDPDFALALVGLANVTYYREYRSNAYFHENYLDSMKIFADMALKLDDQLAEAHLILGGYYQMIPDTLKALDEFDRVLMLNPNSWEAYRGLGILFTNNNHIEAIKNLLKAYSLYHGPELPDLLSNLSEAFAFAGFYENSRNYIQQALELGLDSGSYYNRLAINENWQGHYRQAMIYCLNGLRFDSANVGILDRLAYNYMFAGDFEHALEYYRKVEFYRSGEGNMVDLNDLHRIGYVFAKNGLEEEANNYMQWQEEVLLQSIDLGRPHAKTLYAYYDLGGVYAFRGEKEKALKNLKVFKTRKKESGWMVTLIQDDPLFDSIREEPEFQQIVLDVKSKYMKDFNATRAWLFEQGLL